MGFDFKKLGRKKSLSELCTISDRPTTIPVEKPNKKLFFAVHPDEEDWSMAGAIFEDAEKGLKYFVTEEVLEAEPEFTKVCSLVIMLFCLYRRHGDAYFIWDAKEPNGGPGDSWHNSALSIAQEARTEWRRMVADQGINGYLKSSPEAVFEEPIWPTDWGFNDAMNLAFGDRVIVSADHDVVLRLLGRK